MKKFLVSFFFIATSAGYALSQYMGGAAAASTAPVAMQTTTAQTSAPPSDAAPHTAASQTQSPPATQPSTPVPTPTPTPTPKPTGQYVDGTYTGSAADAYYGTVQVEAIVAGGKLTDVKFLQYPNDRSTSRAINGQAMPVLRTEAIRAQSANVSGVSGASDTSAAFVESLGSALAQAKA